MTWWMILLLIFAVLLAIGCIPVGVDARYDASGTWVAIKLGPVRLQLLPVKKKRKKAKKEKETKEILPKETRVEEKPSSLLSGGWEGLRPFLELAMDMLGDLRRKLRVDELQFYVYYGDREDAARTAIQYGTAWAVIGGVTPVLDSLFVIKKRDIQPILDYNGSKFKIYAHLCMSITIGRSLALAVHAGIRFLKILIKKKKAVQ